MDYSALTPDWATDVGPQLLAVGGAIVGILVVFSGVKLVIRQVRGA